MDNSTPFVLSEVTDPVELAKARKQWEQADRNSAWLQAHVPEIYSQHRGKCICVAGEELFVADTPEEAFTLAKAAHPEDEAHSPVTSPKRKCSVFMRVSGQWLLCDDGVLRPIVRAGILAADGTSIQAELLADTGADVTVLCDVLRQLGLPSLSSTTQLAGVGGTAASVRVATAVSLRRDDGGLAVIRGQFAAFTELEAMDMSVLGRDISNIFAVIVDRQRDLVCLLGPGHQYTITPTP